MISTSPRLLAPIATAGALALALALVSVGCGGGGERASRTTVTRTVTEPAPPTTTGTTTQGGGIDTLEGASTAPVVVPATNKETALLTAVRVARHEGYDRVVFQMRNTLPGYDIRYVKRPITQDGSGKELAVGGAYVVRVRMENALDADLSNPSAPRTYTGPSRISPATPEVVELVLAGGFEGVLTWAIGLNDRVDFRVSTLQGPPRLVIDFRNH